MNSNEKSRVGKSSVRAWGNVRRLLTPSPLSTVSNECPKVACLGPHCRLAHSLKGAERSRKSLHFNPPNINMHKRNIGREKKLVCSRSIGIFYSPGVATAAPLRLASPAASEPLMPLLQHMKFNFIPHAKAKLYWKHIDWSNPNVLFT